MFGWLIPTKIYSFVQNQEGIKEKKRAFFILDAVCHAVILMTILIAILLFLENVSPVNLILAVLISTISAVVLAIGDKKFVL